jgi:A/G-specific adenine glycosylase
LFHRRSQSEGPIHAGIAVVVRRGARGRNWILVGHRFPDAHLPDLWEFPGGKVHPGEATADSARREVEEETGVRVRVIGLLMEGKYDYPDRTVLLHFHLCAYQSGDPQALGCQGVRWVRPENLDCYPFPTANAPVLEALRAAGWIDNPQEPDE